MKSTMTVFAVLVIALMAVAGCKADEQRPKSHFDNLHQSKEWWVNLFMKRYAENPFNSTNKSNVACVVVLRYYAPRFYNPYIILRKEFENKGVQPEISPYWVQFTSDKAIDFLCESSAAMFKEAGFFVTYIDKDGVVKGFRCINHLEYERIPEDPGPWRRDESTIRRPADE